MNKYDLVLYDLDGTLWDSVPLIMESLKKAYDIVLGGTDRTDADLMSYIGKPLGDTFSMHDEETKARLTEAYLEYNCARMREKINRAQSLEEMERLLRSFEKEVDE